MDWYAKVYEEGTGGPRKIIEKSSGNKTGVIAYYFFKPEHRKPEVGFWLFPSYWNKGLISEALEKRIAYCKNEKDIHPLEAYVEEGNGASDRVLEKAGFRYEGTCVIAKSKTVNSFICMCTDCCLISNENQFLLFVPYIRV